MRKALVSISCALLAACSSTPAILSNGDLPLTQNAPLPPPTSSDQVSATRPYLLAPFDKLSVQVFDIPELSREQLQIDASGRVSVPLVGSIDAAGLTADLLAAEIESRLRGNYVRNPQVTVNLTETVSQVVTVDGQVAKPGLYPVIGKMTLQRAVATAGGVGEYANLEDVVIFRTVDGQRMAGLYNLGAIRAGAYADPEIFSNDVVIVGDSPQRRLFRDLSQSSSLITTPLLILFR
ncbi:polysaccharide biosynthesis/export family protein [Alteriqipengyuania sp. WL0013]|uniref:polysaccharide biosynthesis/export family protein n=1 Tax=Alteriqipengyuania sp. WL0013 TaxID=3110773 RepID=UPI002CD6CA40|nr:polysaccharide biosynthesis/export family protein [Alteriqipengyuania sp. WL0013]MEB3415619.1 polysaccharide biosynthesis/export family protein [Alteriqipengyuania sp. WL0013]